MEIVGIVLGIIAIGLTLYFRKEVNRSLLNVGTVYYIKYPCRP